MSARRVTMALMLLLLLSAFVFAADEGGEKVPTLRLLTWAWPHELSWRNEDGPRWGSVGHTATVVSFVPLGVRQQGGEVVETRDGTGDLYGVEMAVHGITALDAKTGAPAQTGPVEMVKPTRIGEPPPAKENVAPWRILAADPDGATPKRGLHRKPNGNWDFYFGPLPKAPYTFYRRVYFRRSDDFQYCLIVHAEADFAPLAEPLRARAGGDKAFKRLRIYVLVAELLDDPDVKMTVSWPDGAPMPRALQASTAWYAKRPVKTRWMVTPRPMVADLGPLRVDGDGALHFLPADTTSIAIARREAAERKAAFEAGMPKIEQGSGLIEEKEGGPEL